MESSPAMANVGRLDYVTVPVMGAPIIRDEGKDVWRGSVDRRERVLYRPDHAGNLQGSLF